MSELPPGWALANLPDMLMQEGVFSDGDWVDSKDQDPDGDVRLIQLADVGDGSYRNRSARFLTSSKAQELGCTFLQPGDVLIARMPNPLGRACLFPGDSKASVTVVDVCLVRPSSGGVSPRWLMYTVNAPQARRAMVPFEMGTTRKRISRKNLARIPLPVPPLAEQERIVAAIEEQFSRLDAGVAALERVRRNLKRMRAAVLRAATLGMLVPHDPSDPSAESWLMASGKPAVVGTPDGPKFPPGWAFTTIGALKTWSLYGPRFSSDDYVVEGTPVLRTTDITDTGRILVGQAPKLALARGELEKYRVHVGDVLITRTGSIGTVAYISDEQPAIPGAYLILYRFGLPVQFSEFLFYRLQSPQVQSQLVGKSAGIGRPNLNAPSIDGIVVGVPPWDELLRIVGEVRAQLDSIDRLDDVLRAAGARVAASRSSILAAAFSGKLVLQDTTDEPASVLLERIAGERASSNGHTPSRVRKPRTARTKVPA